MLQPEATAALFGVIADAIARSLGWFYILAVTLIVGFVLWVGISRYGNLRLGPPDSRPEYDHATWFAMLFTAGIGTVLMSYGVAEPIAYCIDNPLGEDRTTQAAQEAIHLSLYRYGLHAWGVFGLVGLALAYFSFRKGLPLSIRMLGRGAAADRGLGRSPDGGDRALGARAAASSGPLRERRRRCSSGARCTATSPRARWVRRTSSARCSNGTFPGARSIASRRASARAAGGGYDHGALRDRLVAHGPGAAVPAEIERGVARRVDEP